MATWQPGNLATWQLGNLATSKHTINTNSIRVCVLEAEFKNIF